MNLIRRLKLIGRLKFNSPRKTKQDELDEASQVQLIQKKRSKMNLIGRLKFNSPRKKKQDELDEASQVQLGKKNEAR